MRILVINPNTTTSMTEKIGHAAKAAARTGTEIIAVNPQSGPESIEGYYDEAFAVPGLIAELRQRPAVDAVVIACFDDTGLDAARCITNAPVVGIGEAAFHMASLVANRFSVVTTLARSVPAIEHNLAKYGLAARCAKVRAAEVPVLELETSPENAHERISLEIERALGDDTAEAVVLGCAGMADLTSMLQERHQVPVLDGVACAVALAEAMSGLGLRTSASGGYAPPRAKTYTGELARFAPSECGDNESAARAASRKARQRT